VANSPSIGTLLSSDQDQSDMTGVDLSHDRDFWCSGSRFDMMFNVLNESIRRRPRPRPAPSSARSFRFGTAVR